MHLVGERLKLQNKVGPSLCHIYVYRVILTAFIYTAIIVEPASVTELPRRKSLMLLPSSSVTSTQTVSRIYKPTGQRITYKTHPDHSTCQMSSLSRIPILNFENSGILCKVSEGFLMIMFKNDTNYIPFFL
jgi:hypothetical protein